jgi:hypothetical protein
MTSTLPCIVPRAVLSNIVCFLNDFLIFSGPRETAEKSQNLDPIQLGRGPRDSGALEALK